jgi:hypothetical protein
MATQDRIYFAQRAAEEQELAAEASNPEVAEAHRRLQRAYLERASVGERPSGSAETMSPGAAPAGSLLVLRSVSDSLALLPGAALLRTCRHGPLPIPVPSARGRCRR